MSDYDGYDYGLLNCKKLDEAVGKMQDIADYFLNYMYITQRPAKAGGSALERDLGGGRRKRYGKQAIRAASERV